MSVERDKAGGEEKGVLVEENCLGRVENRAGKKLEVNHERVKGKSCPWRSGIV